MLPSTEEKNFNIVVYCLMILFVLSMGGCVMLYASNPPVESTDENGGNVTCVQDFRGQCD